MPYVRQTTIPEDAFAECPDLDGLQDELLWVMFDDDGHVVLASDNRSKVFFFAAENEIPLHRIQ
jgi:hypothetical protein